jgi:hypothetical protein
MQSNKLSITGGFLMKIATFSALILSFAVSTTAIAASNSEYSPFGALAPLGTATRTVEVSPNTKAINVNDGDSVRFNVNGKVFEWTFYLAKQREGKVPLSDIAPAGMSVGNAIVYVGENRLYFFN